MNKKEHSGTQRVHKLHIIAMTFKDKRLHQVGGLGEHSSLAYLNHTLRDSLSAGHGEPARKKLPGDGESRTVFSGAHSPPATMPQNSSMVLQSHFW